ncbi:alpha-glucuronidase [Asticcacaulis biprosthecium C19]|uniref:Xylan alpha-1,2-glucuronidase n=1 Tax=Asticcacaulis biprosthecium C19 TaxID=715226 RepID=F4QMQ3_9CAUL|nr:alpha-glucuronidase family glycosyl hydrolase [Asticcacaulis biprosthecium]EGF91494.1 alpha-glucuronidase [Asticcacaulis biprosthecium C19]
MLRRLLIAFCLLFCATTAAHADPLKGEDGYDLWLRYRPVEAAKISDYKTRSSVIVTAKSPTLDAAASELQRGLGGMLGATPPNSSTIADGAIVLVTPADNRGFAIPADLDREGFVIKSTTLDGHPVTVIAGGSDVGVLYGAFRYLKLIQTGQTTAGLDIQDAPKLDLRVLDHWDNLDGHVERGYAGTSLWDWWRLPDLVDTRYTDYARANASIGINGAVLNNVNAKADSLTEPYLKKAAAIAETLRPYGMKIYLSARFSAPMELGGLKTADPEDPAVAAWWQMKANEIYSIIPDFGGFLVKANSEGQPGPGDYKRTHAQGANMLAKALKPHGGIVMWRAFVYSEHDATDRAKQAYLEFQPSDGQFADNVLVQIKNGAIDFQPREPFHPLFGAMPKTQQMMEFQITKEYLGFATHLAYLAPMWEEALQADTFAKGKGSTVANVIDGTLDGHKLTGMAGVANIGDDRNWTGSDFDQANWYAFGRFAWNPESKSADIATDWARMTWSNDPKVVATIVPMMMGSREAVVHYMTPLGLAHLMDTGHHYGPGPWVSELGRPEWNPAYYHKADANGIGFDRTKTGSNALAQYHPAAAKPWLDPKKTDERFLLWFHHVPWDFKMKSGRPLWDELVVTYSQGVDEVSAMRKTWAGLEGQIDAARFDAVTANLTIQEREAQWWRDACLTYFQSISKRPLPAGLTLPGTTVEDYRKRVFPYAPGRG